MSRVKFLAFGCIHEPLGDKQAADWAVGRIEEEQPDLVVCAGDLHEADSASRWPSEYDWTLADEYAAANAFLKRVRIAAPKARRVYLPGNHDDNLLRIGRLDRKIRDRCDWRQKQYVGDTWLNEELLTQWERPAQYIYCRNKGVFRLGQITFAHGYEHSGSCDEFHSILLGQPFGLYVGAHTHRPEPVTQAQRTRDIPLPYWYCNVGCLRDLKPSYVARKRTHRWGQAICIGAAEPLKSPRAGRRWEAAVEVFRMYDSWASSTR